MKKHFWFLILLVILGGSFISLGAKFDSMNGGASFYTNSNISSVIW
jgi:hypothetical protein